MLTCAILPGLRRFPAREVTGLQDVVLANTHGNLAPAKPFWIFGPQAAIGDSFYIGSAEVFGKELDRLNVCIDKDTPAPDFDIYYGDYNTWLTARQTPPEELIRKKNFGVTPSLLTNGQWIPLKTKRLYGGKLRSATVQGNMLWGVDLSGRLLVYDIVKRTLQNLEYLCGRPLNSCTFANDGTLWCLDAVGQLGMLDVATLDVSPFTTLADWRLAACTFAPDGTMWCVGASGHVGVYDQGNDVMTDHGNLGGWSLKSCTFGRDGALWCVNQDGRVGKYVPDVRKMTDLGFVETWVMQTCTFAPDNVLWCINEQGEIGTTDASITTMTNFGNIGGMQLRACIFETDSVLWWVNS